MKFYYLHNKFHIVSVGFSRSPRGLTPIRQATADCGQVFDNPKDSMLIPESDMSPFFNQVLKIEKNMCDGCAGAWTFIENEIEKQFNG